MYDKETLVKMNVLVEQIINKNISLYELIAVLLSFNTEELSCLEHLLLRKDKEFERENDSEGEV